MTEPQEPENQDSLSALDAHTQVITIVFDQEDAVPRVDLGDVTPHVAYAMLSSIVDALQEIMMPPKISYEGRTIFEPIFIENDDD
jgi:hypothetical protein